jgi:hypothetical protein
MSEPPSTPQYGADPGGYPPPPPGGYPPPPNSGGYPPPPNSGGYPPQPGPGGYPPPPNSGGYPPQYGGYPPPGATGPRNGLGTASLIVAIVSLITVFGGVVFGIVAIVLGVMGRGRVKRGEATNGGVALAGIILGALSFLVSAAAIVIITVFGVTMFNEVGGTDYVDCVNQAGDDQQAIQDCADEFTQRVEDQFSITVTPTP